MAFPVHADQFASLEMGGTYEVSIDGVFEQIIVAFDGSISLDIPEGMHTVEVGLLGLPDPTPTPIPSRTATVVLAEIPDIRFPASLSGKGLSPVLDLDDYVLDSNHRNLDGLQAPLTWAEESVVGEDNTDVVANELQVSVPARMGQTSGVATLSVTNDENQKAFSNPIHVKTTDFLLGGPLVDDFLVAGEIPAAPIPYGWGVQTGVPLSIPFEQPTSMGGQLFLNVSTGLGKTSFLSGRTVWHPASQTMPLAPLRDPIQILGTAFGTSATSSLTAAGLRVEADLSGMRIEAQAGFERWTRVTVTRTTDSGASDCYTLTISQILAGTEKNLSGNLEDGADQGIHLIAPEIVYGFEEMTVSDLLGAPNVAAYENDPSSARSAQTTTWAVSALSQQGNDLKGGTLPEIDITDIGKPAATFPGATSGRALKLVLDREDRQGILLNHRGIDPSEYDPGDILTFSMNLYVDLNYGGGTESPDEINEASNGLTLVMAMTAEPFGTSGVFNYISVPPSEQLIEEQNAVESQYGIDLGHHAGTNISAILHGKWTRHEVSYRVPEVGQAVQGGPGGTGDLVDPNGLAPKILIGRNDTGLKLHSQTVWIDNLSVSRTPGALGFAQGAVNCPMVSAGWSVQYSNGLSGTVMGQNDSDSLPPALARGTVINGDFSTACQGLPPIPLSGRPFFRIAENASAGWTDDRDSTDVAFIATGDPQVALPFPTGFNQSLALTPDPLAAGLGTLETPSHDLGIPTTGYAGMVGVQTPFLDMGLASAATKPGLHVNDVHFEAGTENPGLTSAGIEGNVSGVFGVRWFARTNGSSPADNPQLNIILSNADYTNGLISQQPPQTLPNGADGLCSDTAWVENQMSGTFISFSSNRNYDFFVHQQSASNPTTRSFVEFENPGAQLAQITVSRSNPGAQDAIVLFGATGVGLNGYEKYLGEYPYGEPPQAVLDAVPGRYCTATVFVDEVNLYAVRDVPEFYDEDLCTPLLLP